MSFRGRLFIFFTIIVIVPMAAVAVVLFRVTSDSETGKADSRIAQGLTTALAVYQADIDRADGALAQVARDPQMSRALARRKGGAGRARARQLPGARPVDVTMGGKEIGGRSKSLKGPPLPSVAVGVLDRVDSGAVRASRVLIGGILLAFLILALASSILVVRALQGQIGEFLSAARRLGKGDFSSPVPIHGSDEFAELGEEFNKMSEELASHIAELQRKREELEEAIHRVGQAVGAGLDREGVVALVVQTAVEACWAT